MKSLLADHARVWVYAAERALTPDETALVSKKVSAFVQGWAAHGSKLMADGFLLHQRFLVLAVDEHLAGASGCSIDASVHFVQGLGAEIGLDFFNRMVFHFQDEDGQVHSLPRQAFKSAYDSGKIQDHTVVFDPLVASIGDLKRSFTKPLNQSWHARMV